MGVPIRFKLFGVEVDTEISKETADKIAVGLAGVAAGTAVSQTWALPLAVPIPSRRAGSSPLGAFWAPERPWHWSKNCAQASLPTNLLKRPSAERGYTTLRREA